MDERFRFRAWLKEFNKMVEPIAIRFVEAGTAIEYYNDNGVLCLDSCKFYELMQNTGLQDVNQKYVFEGDIIKCSRGCPHEVIWLKEYGGRNLLDIGGMPAFYLSGIKDGYAWTGEEEIIGNIYENPDLLSI